MADILLVFAFRLGKAGIQMAPTTLNDILPV